MVRQICSGGGRRLPPRIAGVAPAAVGTTLRLAVDRFDARATAWMAAHAVTVTRLALGFIFLWYGGLKFFPSYSPAEELAGRTVHDLTRGALSAETGLRLLAAWETLIGMGLLTGRYLRATLLLLFLQLPGTFLPVVFYGGEIWYRFPFSATIEGQYIFKNLVLVGAALTIGATVRRTPPGRPLAREAGTRGTASSVDRPRGVPPRHDAGGPGWPEAAPAQRHRSGLAARRDEPPRSGGQRSTADPADYGKWAQGTGPAPRQR